MQTLPPELIYNIVDSTDADDYLSLMLTCKSLKSYLTAPLQDVIISKYGKGITYRTVRSGGFWGFYGPDRLVSQIPQALTSLANCHARLEAKLFKEKKRAITENVDTHIIFAAS